ncbi:carboxypeptidase-like regulatory domain-containing protein [bacterium]|nr:carboxypeptidase-like regulatory domain-containing protein [bacterium]
MKVKINSIVIIMIAVSILLSGQLYAALNVWHPLQPELSPAQPDIEILEESSDHLIVRMNISGIYIDQITEDKEVYQKLHFSSIGDVSKSIEGEPLLPMLTKTISIPENKNASVKIISVDWQYFGDFNLFPRQLPRRDDGSLPGAFIKSEDAYSLKSMIPDENVGIGRIKGWGGVAVAPLTITPLRYIPSTQRLEIASSITVRIDFTPGNPHNIVKPSRSSARMNKLHQLSILNPPALVDLPLDSDENEPIRMLVIVREEALETAQPLIDFHHERGLRTEVWIGDDIEDEYEIKDRVIEMYQEGLEYLFLIGDAYTRNDDSVPIHFWDPEDPGWQDEDDTRSHSDNWYICLDEPDGDGFEDHLPDLSVGRLVYDRDSINELEVQVNKIMSYLNWGWEQNNDGDWLSRAILVAHRELDNREGGRHFIMAKQAIAAYNYSQPHPEFITFYGTDNNATNEAIIETINGEGCILFNFRGHGDNNAWSPWNARGQRWDIDEVNQLENANSPFILISSACWTGNIATHNGECLMESFQKQDAGGSMAAHGCIISTYTRGNGYFDSTLFKGWFDEGLNDIGYAEIWAMSEMVNHWADDWYAVIGRMNMRAYAWQGDPALEIRLTQPQDMEINIPEWFNLGIERISAGINLNNEPLEDAKICIRGNDDEIYVVGTSDANGRLTLVFETPIEEAMLLSWTAYHRLGLPASGVITVLDSAGSIEGTVTSLANEEPIEGALVRIAAFDLERLTDDEGNYNFWNIPATEHVIEVSAMGYISETTEVLVIEDSTHSVNFELRNSVFSADSLEITQHLEENESQRRHFIFTNSGTGELIWSAVLEYIQKYEEFEVINDFHFAEATNDNKINGAEYINGKFYITGSHDNADPNYIYVIDDNSGEMIHRYNQPDGCGGSGIQDLAFDGENLYGGCGSYIYVINLEGELVRSFEGTYNPNSALTFDEDYNLWVGSNNQALYKIDTDGSVLDTIPNELPVKALAWYPNADEGYKLLMFVSDATENQVLLYRANPETHDVRFLTNLTTVDENLITSNGLTVSMSYNPLGWTLLGTVIDGEERIVRAWHLSDNNDWLRFNPDSGRVEPDEDDMITFIFTAPDNSDGMSFRSTFRIETNSLDQTIELPILLEVGFNSIPDEREKHNPVAFTLGKAYPNPFNAKTVIPVELPVAGRLEAYIYDISGRRILELASGKYFAGRHEFVFTAEDLASGVYLLRVDFNGSHAVQKVVLLR